MSKNLIFIASFVEDSVLEGHLDQLGWTAHPSGRRRKTILKCAKKKLRKKLGVSGSVDDYKLRFKAVPLNSQRSIEDNLGILQLSQIYELRVDKFLAHILGYSNLLVGKNIDSEVVLYFTSTKSSVAHLNSFLSQSLIKRLTKIVRFSGVIQCLDRLSGIFLLKKNSFSNVLILRPCLVASLETKSYLINSEPSMNAISQRLGTKPSGFFNKKSIARLPHFEEVKLEVAHYPFSRKEELFFHALHWTLPKAMKAIDNMQLEENSILLINEELNATIKENLLNYAKTKLSVDRIKLIDYKCSVHVKKLHLYSTEYQNQYGNFVYQNKLELSENLNSILSYQNHDPYILQSNRILLLRKDNAREKSDRGLENWSEIQEIFLNRGFTLIDLGKLTLFQQLQIYKEAEIVIGLHGGHFSQMFCAKSTAKIVEIFSGLYSSCFQDMANQYNLEYHSVGATKQKGGWYLDSKRAVKFIETLSF